jgi:hypothetical protein
MKKEGNNVDMYIDMYEINKIIIKVTKTKTNQPSKMWFGSE